MTVNEITIIKAVQADYLELITVWEEAVKATHHFLQEGDILLYRKLILEQYFNALSVYYLVKETKKIGFIGLSSDKIEMLFIDPFYFGKGYGKMLLDFGILEHGILYVDVNEQNTRALTFYEKQGFVVFNRQEKDNEGKDFPVLQMRLQRQVTV